MSVKKAVGNMYPWVSHTHNHLRGECPHGCRYCYVQTMARRFRSGHYYAEPLRLAEKELRCSYDTPAIRRYAQERGFERPAVFVEHCNDLFANGVPSEWIYRVLEHCQKHEDEVEFVFQSKNPSRMIHFCYWLPERCMVGITVETDSRDLEVVGDLYSKNTPPNTPLQRLTAICDIHRPLFVTVKPVLRMENPVRFAQEIASCRPEFVNIGADSKGHGLPEPSSDQLCAFIKELHCLNVPIRQKTNLERLLT
jgi:DNA repair photolyase